MYVLLQNRQHRLRLCSLVERNSIWLLFDEPSILLLLLTADSLFSHFTFSMISTQLSRSRYGHKFLEKKKQHLYWSQITAATDDA